MEADLLTAAITVVLGFIVFVLGQIAQRFFLEPIQEQKQVIGEIAFAVLYYMNVSNIAKQERREEAEVELRKLAGQLRATMWTISWYGFLEALWMVEKRKNVIEASQELVGWSNSLDKPDGGAPLRVPALVKDLRLPEISGGPPG